MKVLTVCAAGTVRSGSMALASKQHGNPDTIQCGVDSNSPATLRMLEGWADQIWIAESAMADHFLAKEKIVDMALGPDRWGIPLHPDLMALLERRLAGDRS